MSLDIEMLPVLLMNYFLEPRAKVISGERSIFTHLPKDRNCNICLRTGIAQTEEKNKVIFKENQTDLLQPHFETHLGMMVKLGKISGPFQAILFTLITCNPESNCTCRKKNHFLFS